jgi:chitodextrinase
VGKVTFTTKGYIEAWWLPPGIEIFLSRHRSEAEAIEAITSHAAQVGGDQQYELRFPNKIVKAFGILNPSGDTVPPTQPTNLSGFALSATEIALSWTASSDAFGVTAYQVWRDEVPVASVGVTSYTDSALTPSTAYSYKVAAVDAAGNQSVFSDSAIVTTNANSAPVWSDPGAQALTVSEGYSLDLASLVSDADGDPIEITLSSGTPPSGLTFNTQSSVLSGTPDTVQTVNLTFSASDGIAAPVDLVVQFVALNADTTAPSVPTGLAGVGTGGERIELTWNASTDPTVTDARTSGVSAYKVYRDSALRVTLGNVLAYSDTSVAADTNYSYTVSAVDAAGNESAQSDTVVVSTAAFGWTIPDVAYEVVTPTSGTLVENETWTYDVSQHVNLAGQTAVYSISSVTPTTDEISIDSASGVVTGTATVSDSYSVQVDLAAATTPVGDAEADWLYRSGQAGGPYAAGVVWAHDFRSYSEVSQFLPQSENNITDDGTVIGTYKWQDPNRADPVTYQTPQGAYLTLFAILPGEQKAKSYWPDRIPGAGSGVLISEIPNAVAWNGWPDGTYFRWANSTRNAQAVLPDGTVLPSPTTVYGNYNWRRFIPAGGWYRPLCPLTGATNGKGVDDPAANGTIPLQSFPKQPTGINPVDTWENTPRGYWTHPSEDPGNGSVVGNEFWLQMRVWVSPSRSRARLPVQPYTYGTTAANKIPPLLQWNSPNNPYPGQAVESIEGGKHFMLARKRELPGEWINDIGVITTSTERYGYKTYRYYPYTHNDNGYPPIKYPYNGDILQTNPAHSGGYHETCRVGLNINTPNACWEYPEGEWYTMMLRFRPGRTNTYPNYTYFDTLIETRVAKWGETSWTWVFYDDTFPWFWDDNVALTHPKGMSSLRLTSYSNDVPMWDAVVQAYTQVIFSTQEIPCPQVY